MKKRLLLISNSTCHGQGYLDHVESEIKDFLGKTRNILFIPYALFDRNKYASIVQERFKKMGISLKSIHKEKSPTKAIEKADALFIGGGNTFRLLFHMYNENIIEAIKKKVENGIPYIGTSAGANVACPTIKTTNDMPILYPSGFKALNLIPFQINPHYIDTDTNSRHMGETREQRIKEFLEENNIPVVGLREGTWLRIENNSILLKGKLGTRVFERGKNPKEYFAQSSLSFLLKD